MIDPSFQASRQRKNHHRRFCATGNTLLEYSVCAGIIGLVSLSLLLAGDNIGQWISMLKQTMQQQAVTAQREEQETKAYALALRQNNAPGQPQVATPNVTLVDQGSLQIDLGAKIQTLGANGTTALLSSQLQAVAEKLSAEGSIDKAQYDQLVKLANQGHEIAEIEALVEQAIADSNGKIYKLEDSSYSFGGRTYSMEDLYESIGFGGTSDIPDDLGNFSDVLNYNPGKNMKDFLKTYSELQNSGMMKRPEVRAMVEQAVSSISVIAESTQHEMNRSFYENSNIAPDMLKNALAKDISKQSQYYSAQICTSGNGQDSGSSCSPTASSPIPAAAAGPSTPMARTAVMPTSSAAPMTRTASNRSSQQGRDDNNNDRDD